MNGPKLLKIAFMLNLILVGWSTERALAQNPESKVQIGIFTEYAFTIPTLVDGQIADKFVLLETPENLDGFRVGIFGRWLQQKRMVNLELAYFQGFSSFAHYDLQSGWDFLGYSGFMHRQFKFSVGYGVTVLKNVSLDAGVVGIYQMKDRAFYEPDTIPGQVPMSERANWLLSQAFSPFLLSGYVRGSYQFGPLNLYLIVEQNITSLFGRVKYREEEYPVSVRMQLWSLGFSYTIFSKSRK